MNSTACKVMILVLFPQLRLPNQFWIAHRFFGAGGSGLRFVHYRQDAVAVADLPDLRRELAVATMYPPSP